MSVRGTAPPPLHAPLPLIYGPKATIVKCQRQLAGSFPKPVPRVVGTLAHRTFVCKAKGILREF